MNLTPNQQYNITRQLDNVTDTNKYYVQAVVRNNAGKTLATINLTDNGNQRFSAPYQVPADTSGMGMYISITTYVFDDPNYSIPDGNYATEDNEYLVIQPPLSTFGNGGTTIVDYDKIKKFISDIKFPSIPNYDSKFSQIKEHHDEQFNKLRDFVGKNIKEIKMTKYDDSSIKQSINTLQKEIESLRATHEASIKAITQSHEKTIAESKSNYEKSMELMNNKIDRITEKLSSVEKERDYLSQEYDNLKQDYLSLTNTFSSLKTKWKDEGLNTKQNTIDIRVKKLLGI
jgi:hypothetical protein